ncbi:MAG: hypothetical protein OEV30_08420 [Ignavibacteria bacterium]|nr:hypothetical protein [Ignavibacteria bacterium]
MKDEATFILGSLYRSFEIDYLEASKYFRVLHQRHPGNLALETQYRQTSLAGTIEQNGISWLRENLDTIPEEYGIGNSGVLNGMAYSFMGQQETDVALALFHANIDLFPDEANPFDSLAECYATLGNTEEAIRYSKLCLEKLDGDVTINDQFRETLKELNEERLQQMGAGTGV